MYNTVILVNNTTLHTSKLLSESEVAQSCLTLCDPVDCSSPGSSVHGVLQARIQEGLPCLPPGDLPNPEVEPRSPALQVDSLPTVPTGKPKYTGVGSLSLLQGINRRIELGN